MNHKILIMEQISENAYQTVSPEKYEEAIKNPDVYLLDVRKSDEFAEGHIEGANNLDVTAPDFLEKAEKILPRDKTIAVYCGTGRRAGIAAGELSAAGYKIISLEGGLTAWTSAGKPVVK